MVSPNVQSVLAVMVVVNAGISGARLLSDGMGEKAAARFEQDVLAQPGATKSGSPISPTDR